MKITKKIEAIMTKLPEPPEGIEPFATVESFEDEATEIIITKNMLYLLIKTVDETRTLERDRVRRYKLSVIKETLEKILKQEGIHKMVDQYIAEQERMKTVLEIEAVEEEK